MIVVTLKYLSESQPNCLYVNSLRWVLVSFTAIKCYSRSFADSRAHSSDFNSQNFGTLHKTNTNSTYESGGIKSYLHYQTECRHGFLDGAITESSHQRRTKHSADYTQQFEPPRANEISFTMINAATKKCFIRCWGRLTVFSKGIKQVYVTVSIAPYTPINSRRSQEDERI